MLSNEIFRLPQKHKLKAFKKTKTPFSFHLYLSLSRNLIIQFISPATQKPKEYEKLLYQSVYSTP